MHEIVLAEKEKENFEQIVNVLLNVNNTNIYKILKSFNINSRFFIVYENYEVNIILLINF